jgi:hypothetical protein
MAAVRDKPEAKEGDPPQGTYFIVAFDSLADAKKWYSTPPYKDLIPERQKAAGQTSSSSRGCRNNAAAPDNRCWRARSPSVGAVGNGRVAPMSVIPTEKSSSQNRTLSDRGLSGTVGGRQFRKLAFEPSESGSGFRPNRTSPG